MWQRHACRAAAQAALVLPACLPRGLPPCSAHASPARPPAPPTAKREGDQLFECFDAQDLNVRLKELMDGLSVKASLCLMLG